MGGRPKIIKAFSQTGISGPASSTSASFRSPRPKNKQPKRRRSSATVGKNKRAKNAAPESYPEVMIPVAAPNIVGLSTGSFPSSVDEKPTTSTALAAAASHPSTLSASSPSSLTVPPANAMLSPPVISIREEDVSP
ncbi:PREDICTED: putative protein TPRXL [Nicotiana attenuata]|uniref:putative protein TPRXL n=1 Tax=Nicotiana attenuata TaxID=49451 RepID=UPI0009053EBA|nr:PREDICTED: putative protein TPRXL [Nicotiana attenuata]